MRIFSTASIISQAFKNAHRVREITGVLVSHGLAEIVDRMKLSRFLPARYSKESKYQHLPLQERLRLSFEHLGPTFVKLGQLLASRPDLIPEPFVEEFQKLQDRVGTVPTSEIRIHLERELGKKVEDVFDDFEETPMAAASIAQVHGARLKSGEKVAIKIQRPGIEKTIATDISILKGVALLLERYIPESKIFNPSGIVDEFFKTISFELDFRIEANNMRRIKTNLVNYKDVVIPTVYPKVSTNRILVLERLEGIRFSNQEALQGKDIDLTKVVDTGCNIFFHMVMHDGIFHGDFHGGNLFILPDGKLGLIDFGIVGRLSNRVRDSVITMFISIMDEDFDTLASEYMYLSQATDECDLNRFQKDLMDLISPYIGMALGEVNIGNVLLHSTAVAARHHLRVPRELMLLFKAMGMIESLGKTLDPHFDLLSIGTRLARQTLAERYSKDRLMKDLVVVGRDVQYLLETTPRLVKRFLRRWSQNNFVVETRSKDVQSLSESIRLLTFFFMVSVLAISFVWVGTTFITLDVGPLLWDTSVFGILLIGCSFSSLSWGLWSLRSRLTK